MTTMRTALQQYFESNGFGADGGYSASWVDFKVGTIPFPFPNTDARKKAVKFHDLNHILTGYRTDTVSEFEISAWEIGAGCRHFAAAWVINLGGLTAGTFAAPVRTFRAFVRGRRQRASYWLPYEATLEREVDDVKRELGVTDEQQSPSLSDVVLFPLALAVGLVTSVVMLTVLLSPVTLLLWWRGRKLKAVAVV
ncbi:MAG: hypothetical protein ACO1OB_32955 [Archangium sp.]